MDTNILIGLTVEKAISILSDNGISQIEVKYYTDRKQQSYDTEKVVRVKITDGHYQLLVCPMQMSVSHSGE